MLMTMTNTVSKADVLKECTKLGADVGKGNQARVDFCMELLRAGYHRAITPDDAGECYAAYLRGKAVAQSLLVNGKLDKDGNVKAEPTSDFNAFTGEDDAEASGNGTAANTSKFRTFIKLGYMPESVCADPIGVMVDAGRIVAHIMGRPLAEGEKRPSIKTFDSLVKVAREQLKADHMLTPTEIEDIVRGRKEDEEPKVKTEKDMLTEEIKRLQSIRDGKKDKDGNVERPAYPSKAVETSIAWLENRLAEINAAESAAKLGLMLSLPLAS